MGIDFTVIVVTLLLIIFGLAITLIACKYEKTKIIHGQHYYAFFILGICFLPLGIVFALTTNNLGFLGLTSLGLIYTLIGIIHKSKWQL